MKRKIIASKVPALIGDMFFFLGDEDLYYIMIFYRTIYFKVLFLGWQEEDIDSH